MTTQTQILAARTAWFKAGGLFANGDDAFRAALEAAERVAWRPVSEAPKDGKDVLVTGWAYGDPAKGRYQDVALWYRGDWMSEECGQSIHPPTHFRPLPAPPEEGMPA